MQNDNQKQNGDGLAMCPECITGEARGAGDQWTCEHGCDLTGYQQCPACGVLYKGYAPFCPAHLADG